MPANKFNLRVIRRADMTVISHPREVSYHQFDDVMNDVEQEASNMDAGSIINIMIKLEEEMGCSIWQAAANEIARRQERNTVDEHYIHPTPTH